jgi:hypothetical protein
MKLTKAHLFFLGALVFVGIGLYSNIAQQAAKDRTKLPLKVEDSSGFQRWITNLKKKGLTIEADEFKLYEEVEVYNTKWMHVYSIDDVTQKAALDTALAAYRNTPKIVYSPSDREFIDFRNIDRDGYTADEVHFYGQKEDKILDLRALSCLKEANCLFERAYFLSNDVFVVIELSRDITKNTVNPAPCSLDQSCSYTFKIHLIDLINNSRSIYVSKPFDAVYNELLPKL